MSLGTILRLQHFKRECQKKALSIFFKFGLRSPHQRKTFNLASLALRT